MPFYFYRDPIPNSIYANDDDDDDAGKYVLITVEHCLLSSEKLGQVTHFKLDTSELVVSKSS